MPGLEGWETLVGTASDELWLTTGERVVIGAAALMLLVGLSAGDPTGDSLAVGAGGKDVGALGDCTGAAGEEAGMDGALAELYPVTEQPDLATISVGQVTTSQSTLLLSAVESIRQVSDSPWVVSTLHPIPAKTTARL